MNTSSDPKNFFETDAVQAKRVRQEAKAGNTFGNPIVLKSKILAAVSDPLSPATSVFVALSAGKIRRINLETSSVTATYQGPNVPISCLAVDAKDRSTVYGGSWDKCIWSWDITTATVGRNFVGHSDFVKALLWTQIGDLSVLISGGSDKKIIVWDATTGTRLHTLQDPTTSMLALQALAVDPVLSTPEEVTIVSASSDPHIRRWKVTKDSSTQISEIHPDAPGTERPTIKEHETSVYKLFFDVESEDVDLWTASADGTAKCLSRARQFTTEDEFVHGDYLRAVVATDVWVVTAGRDEDVKVWERGTGKLYCSLVGHFDEITDLVLLADPAGRRHRVCSVGIDATVRVWPLEKGELDKVVEEMEAEGEEEKEEEKKGEGVLTAEEEAELAELMDDD